MDVYCRKCGEPIDTDEFHAIAEETGKTYSQVAAAFRREGCSALDGYRCNPETSPTGDELSTAEKAGIIYDLLGDDMDGAAAMFDDLC